MLLQGQKMCFVLFWHALSRNHHGKATITYHNLLLIDVLDQRPPQTLNSIIVDIILVTSLAVYCFSENSCSRPTMDQVSYNLMMWKSPFSFIFFFFLFSSLCTFYPLSFVVSLFVLSL